MKKSISQNTQRNSVGFLIGTTVLVVIVAMAFAFTPMKQDEKKKEKKEEKKEEKKQEQATAAWVAPESANALKNPEKDNAAATAKGKSLYNSMCSSCHGKEGKGDGGAGAALKPKPADHTSAKVQAESDGSLYWKITEGRNGMLSYKKTLKDEQRWQLVNYIRVLGKKK
ncbi:MAG: c-type cytochrome [Bacteroidia bacterium]